MTDMSSWERLSGGPCDGQQVWVEPMCWAVVASRNSDRRPDYLMQIIEVGEESPLIVANEAHLYLRAAGAGFTHMPNGLERDYRHGYSSWRVKPEEP